MEKIRVSAVSYANTFPLLYGLQHHAVSRRIELSSDPPAVCAEKLREGQADVGLVPVAALPEITGAEIISDFCIGANGPVRSVSLYHNKPLEQIRTIGLDRQSRTSVMLVRLLAKVFWNLSVQWKEADVSDTLPELGSREAVLLIGDKCFAAERKYRFHTDLAAAWKKMTRLPFVFACWITVKPLQKSFTADFNAALGSGLQDIDRVVRYYEKHNPLENGELETYLKHNISYRFDQNKKKALNLFLTYLTNLSDEKI